MTVSPFLMIGRPWIAIPKLRRTTFRPWISWRLDKRGKDDDADDDDEHLAAQTASLQAAPEIERTNVFSALDRLNEFVAKREHDEAGTPSVARGSNDDRTAKPDLLDEDESTASDPVPPSETPVASSAEDERRALEAQMREAGFKFGKNGKIIRDYFPNEPDKEADRGNQQDPVSRPPARTRNMPTPPRAVQGNEGFKPSAKITDLVRNDIGPTPASSPARGLHLNIDRWIEADARNDRVQRVRHAAAVLNDPDATARVRELDKATRIRFERDWDTIRSMPGQVGRDRDGRNITDE